MQSSIQCEFEREGQQVVVALRCPSGRMILTMPMEQAQVFAITVGRVTEVDSDDTILSCILPKCELEIEK